MMKPLSRYRNRRSQGRTMGGTNGCNDAHTTQDWRSRRNGDEEDEARQ